MTDKFNLSLSVQQLIAIAILTKLSYMFYTIGHTDFASIGAMGAMIVFSKDLLKINQNVSFLFELFIAITLAVGTFTVDSYSFGAVMVVIVCTLSQKSIQFPRLQLA